MAAVAGHAFRFNQANSGQMGGWVAGGGGVLFSGEEGVGEVAAAAEGDGEGVGDVGGIGGGFEVPEGLDGALHLGFAGVTVAGEGLFDAVGGVLLDLEGVAGGDEEDYAAGVAHEDGGARVGVMGIELLDGADLGFVFLDQGVEFVFEFDEALGEGGFFGEADDTAVDEDGFYGAVVDDAVTGEAEAGVYA